MLTALLDAYRSEAYHCTFAEVKGFLKENKNDFILLLVFFLSTITLAAVSFILLNIIFSVCSFTIIVVFSNVLDKRIARKYPSYLVRRKKYLKQVVAILQSPEFNLFSREKIDLLIEGYQAMVPAEDWLVKTCKFVYEFAKTIMLPVLAFFFGFYFNSLSNVAPEEIMQLLVIVLAILVAGVAVFAMFKFMSYAFDNKEYHAAMALKRALIDIKLLYFCDSETAPVPTVATVE